MSEHNYEAGGRVQISGKWYDINRDGGKTHVQVKMPNEFGWEDVPIQFIQAYEPPKKKVVHEWLDKRDIMCIEEEVVQTGMDDDYVVNRFLSGLYGAPPIVRTYNGEDAEEFGLERSRKIHVWLECLRYWHAIEFKTLRLGQKWIFQPPAPKEDD